MAQKCEYFVVRTRDSVILRLMSFKKVKNQNIFRKVALATWLPSGDPTVYGLFELDVTDLHNSKLLTPLVAKSIALTLEKHPDLNSIIRWGKVFHRENVDLTILVNIPKSQRHDLSMLTIEDAHHKTLGELVDLLQVGSQRVRKYEDPKLGLSLKLINYLPQFAVNALLSIFSFLSFELNIQIKNPLLPMRPFGAAIITNVGSLGIRKALVPLVPLSRAALLLAIGERTEEVKVIDGKMEIRKIVHIGATFDHRLFDGAQAASMWKDFEAFFKVEIKKLQGS